MTSYGEGRNSQAKKGTRCSLIVGEGKGEGGVGGMEANRDNNRLTSACQNAGSGLAE